ncbi:MAG: hypothetical protein PSV40_02065 [Polaromonas sp.]|nr:hypothetical protein [Polaromonas sp.]MDI1267874.1 hypothetical protein [Polaromonas sp.]
MTALEYEVSSNESDGCLVRSDSGKRPSNDAAILKKIMPSVTR